MTLPDPFDPNNPEHLAALVELGNADEDVQLAMWLDAEAQHVAEVPDEPDPVTQTLDEAREVYTQYQHDVAADTEGMTQEQLNDYSDQMDAYRAGMTVEDWRELRDEAAQHGMSVPSYQAYLAEQNP